MRGGLWRNVACLMLSGAGVAGCGDAPPSGQVLASVGGDEVTKRDVAVEAMLTGLAPGPATLTAVIDRKLLVRRARRERLDLSPDYLAAMRRFREATLATLAVRQETGRLPPIDEAAARAYAAAHPWRFAGRIVATVERVGRQETIDTATLVDADGRRLTGAARGDVVFLSDGAVRLLSSRSVAVPPDGLIEAARADLARERNARVAAAMIAREGRDVRVRYQVGSNPAQ